MDFHRIIVIELSNQKSLIFLKQQKLLKNFFVKNVLIFEEKIRFLLNAFLTNIVGFLKLWKLRAQKNFYG